MTTIEESRLRFWFDESWQVVKYDGHVDHRKIRRLQGTKAVDLVAIHRGQELFFIAVKNFRRYRIENKARIEKSQTAQELDLPTEVALKVRDTIAGIVAACHRGAEDWRPFVACLTKNERSVKVLLWLEQDLPREPPGRESNRKQTLSQALKKSLAWLSTRVLVMNRFAPQFPGGMRVDLLPEVEQDQT